MAMNAAKSESSKDDDVLAFWKPDDKDLPIPTGKKDLSPAAIRELVVAKAHEMGKTRLEAYFNVMITPFYWWELCIMGSALTIWLVVSVIWIVSAAGSGIAVVSSLFNAYCVLIVGRLIFARHVMKIDKRFTMGVSRTSPLHDYVTFLWDSPRQQRVRDQLDTFSSAVLGFAMDPAVMIDFGRSYNPFFHPVYFMAYDKLQEMHGLLFLNKSIEERAKLVGLRAFYDAWGSAQGVKTK